MTFFDYQREKSEGCNSVYIYAYDNVTKDKAQTINDDIINEIKTNVSLATVYFKIFNDNEYYQIHRTYFSKNKIKSKPVKFTTIIDYKYDTIDVTADY